MPECYSGAIVIVGVPVLRRDHAGVRIAVAPEEEDDESSCFVTSSSFASEDDTLSSTASSSVASKKDVFSFVAPEEDTSSIWRRTRLPLSRCPPPSHQRGT